MISIDPHIHCPLLRAPNEIPWGSVGADYVVESTGVFTTVEKVRPLLYFASHLYLLLWFAALGSASVSLAVHL